MYSTLTARQLLRQAMLIITPIPSSIDLHILTSEWEHHLVTAMRVPNFRQAHLEERRMLTPELSTSNTITAGLWYGIPPPLNEIAAATKDQNLSNM